MKEMKEFDALEMKMLIDCKKKLTLPIDELGVIYL